MRKLVFLLVFLLCTSLLWAQELNQALFRSLDKLSQVYQDAYPRQVMRAGLVILELAENSALARQHRLGKTIEAYLREAVGRSLVYELVDRQNLATILQEMEMSLSGVVDPDQIVVIGNLSGVRAFLWGDISDSRDRFLVSLNVTDAETGTVLGSSSFEIEQAKLVKIAEELEYSYVAPNGIGLTAHALYMPFMLSDNYNNFPLIMFDTGLAYRFSRNFMVSAGLLSPLETTDSEFRCEGGEDSPQYAIQPESSTMGSQYRATFMRLDAQYTLNFNPKFNIGFSGGLVSALGNVRMFVKAGGELGGLLYRQLLADNSQPEPDYYYQQYTDIEAVEYLFQHQVIPALKAEIRPEFFITPRIALSARLGFMWMPPLPVREIHAAKGSWWFYSKEKDVMNWVPNPDYVPDPDYIPTVGDRNEQHSSWLYYGWNPLLRPDGQRWTYDISGVIVQLGLSFFF